jgi:hypothetical protein
MLSETEEEKPKQSELMVGAGTDQCSDEGMPLQALSRIE